MKFACFRAIAVVPLALLWAGLCGAQELVVTPDKPDGVYQVGEPIQWRIEWKGEGSVAEATYSVKKGGQTDFAKGRLPLADGHAVLEAKLDASGTLLAEVKVKSSDDRSRTAYGGAVAAPEKIVPSAARPDNFDAFWDAKLQELKAIAVNPQLERGESKKSQVDYWKITLDNIRGTQIRGQLARTTQGEKLPALLIVQWAGVYPLQKTWVTDRAAEGWLVLNINAHDLPIDQPEAFYKEQSAGPLKDYWAIGNDDRDTSYFLRMYLSCYRAADYLTERPDWDGKTLVVSGVSQGGLQALMTAALHPKITAALANVPAGCDMLGPDLQRAPGWPMWYWKTAGKDPEKVRQASRYYDVVNFAPHVKCPVLVGLGLVDQVCPPAGIFAALNQIQTPKEIVILPQADHQEKYNSHKPYYRRSGVWMTNLRQGKPPPPTVASATNIELLQPTPENYLKLASETNEALHKDVLDVWFPRCIDQEHGGYHSNFARDWQPTSSEGKFSVFQARMTWITAQVAVRRPDLKAQFLPHCQHGLKFLREVMWDAQAGGAFWGLDDNGQITPAFGDDKQLYGIGFCMYAAAAAYQATKDPAALELAQRIFRWIDEHAHDAAGGGYFEWLKRDGTPIPADQHAPQPVLRFGLPVGGKSMNTHIHLLEALAQLYQVWPDDLLRRRLEEVLAVVRDKVCREPGVMHLYFTNDWQPTSTRESYGHDIETAYLLLEAAETLGQANDPKTQRMARMLVDHCLQTGWDESYGGIYREGPMLGKPDELAKDWWAQVEGLNALLLMHEKYGGESDAYFKAFQRQWHFIKTHQIDHQHHGLIETVQRDGTPLTQAKGRIWKAAYHDGRSFLNVTERLKKLAKQKH